MNLLEIYQQLIDSLRNRHNQSSEPWCKILTNNYAETLYPNIAAEMDASGYFKSTVSRWAMVSPDILLAVVENSEKLSALELYGLSRLFGCSPGYLSSNDLQVIDPRTNRGKSKQYKLSVLMDQVRGLEYFNKAKTYATYETLCQGRVITSAQYRWAIMALKTAVRANRRSAVALRCVPLGVEK